MTRMPAQVEALEQLVGIAESLGVELTAVTAYASGIDVSTGSGDAQPLAAALFEASGYHVRHFEPSDLHGRSFTRYYGAWSGQGVNISGAHRPDLAEGTHGGRS